MASGRLLQDRPTSGPKRARNSGCLFIIYFLLFGKHSTDSVDPCIFNGELGVGSRQGRRHMPHVLFSAREGGAKYEVPPLPSSHRNIRSVANVDCL